VFYLLVVIVRGQLTVKSRLLLLLAVLHLQFAVPISVFNRKIFVNRLIEHFVD